jgi:hypothetical protein
VVEQESHHEQWLVRKCHSKKVGISNQTKKARNEKGKNNNGLTDGSIARVLYRGNLYIICM